MKFRCQSGSGMVCRREETCPIEGDSCAKTTRVQVRSKRPASARFGKGQQGRIFFFTKGILSGLETLREVLSPSFFLAFLLLNVLFTA